MAVFYNTVQRGNPGNPSAVRKWYPVIKSVKQVGEKQVAKLIADETTLNRKEAEMALAQFEKVMTRLLLDGYTVQLGDWGSFRFTCNGKGIERQDEVKAEHIKGLNIRFHPGKDLKEKIKNPYVFSSSHFSLFISHLPLLYNRSLLVARHVFLT